MAKDRCISSDILMNDNFMSLPNSSKILYVYFNQETDNLGFVDNLESIMRTVKAKPKDLQLLIDREYIIKVKDWLYLETHFRMNNKNLRPERGKRSRFEKHLEEFELNDCGMYCRKNDGKMSAKCRQNVGVTPEQSKVKENKVKESNLLEENTKEETTGLTHIGSVDALKSFLRGGQ